MDREKEIDEIIQTIEDVNEIYVREMDADGFSDIGYSDRYGVNKKVAEKLIEAGYVKLPCKVGDTVWISEIIGLRREANNLPIWRLNQGTIISIQIENDNEIWLNVSFGVLHCCRKVEDFYLTKEAAEARLKELEECENE